jgi:hypothetical protein
MLQTFLSHANLTNVKDALYMKLQNILPEEVVLPRSFLDTNATFQRTLDVSTESIPSNAPVDLAALERLNVNVLHTASRELEIELRNYYRFERFTREGVHPAMISRPMYDPEQAIYNESKRNPPSGIRPSYLRDMWGGAIQSYSDYWRLAGYDSNQTSLKQAFTTKIDITDPAQQMFD